MQRLHTIGYDAKRLVSNATGLGSYSRTLVESLSSFKDLQFLLYAQNKGREELYSNVKGDNLIFKYHSLSSNLANKISQSVWREKTIVKDLLRDNVQVFHGLSGQLPVGIKKSGVKSVVTVHDLIFFSHPEWYSPIDTMIYKRKFHRTIKEADKIIAISECTKRDIMNYGDVEEEKIKVIYQSFNPIFTQTIYDEEKQKIRTRYSLPNRFILNVGTIERRKNVLLVVKALKEIENDIHLVIVGRQTEYTKEVRQYVLQNNLEKRVHIINGVLFDELKVLYSLADLFVYPSIYEGFGIPVIEAIANRLPVIACTGSCLEEAGGDCSLYVKPEDVKGMVQAMNVFLYDNERRNMAIEEGIKHIQRFVGNNVAEKHIDLYNTLLDE